MELAIQPAYVLHRRQYLESSLLLDVFTLNNGRLSCVAKGALSSRQNKAALLQPLQPLLLAFTGKSGLYTLTRCEAASSALTLQGKRLFCLYYVNELLLRLAPEGEAMPSVFAWYAETLAGLQCEDAESQLRCFEVRLLRELGIAPGFEQDASGALILPHLRYAYTSEGQFELSRQGSGIMGDTLLQLGALQQDYYELEGVAKREAKILMRQLIDQALHGRELKSRAFFAPSKN
ncbi:MAG: DNA repair protein RecO [Oleiphilaceae bacterium]|nr:DNA repair protein RecO [Oleiphilaceae bacterium]